MTTALVAHFVDRVTFRLRSPAAGAVLFAFVVPIVMAAQTPTKRAPFPGEQWVQLFNGKDLTNGMRDS